MTFERGALLHKRYRIVEILGQGGMGSVYRAVDENLGVDVAVKENLFTTEEYARQFRLEAVILANLRHPNLPRVTDHFVIGDQGQYLVMDYIEGEDLRQRMERAGNISEDDAMLMGAAMCDALTYLHTRKPPILHRDIKPGNVKITPDGRIFLVDFGLAKVLHGSQATTTGARAMTPGYSPPEQYGTARTDPRTDIYSLGATIYAALTGIIYRFATLPGQTASYKVYLGSCAHLHDPETDSGKPWSGGFEIFDRIASEAASDAQPHLMLWLGDNIYLRADDYEHPSGMSRRYQKVRSHPSLQKLLPALPHYAIWDDHDYGPNDHNQSFVHKQASLDLFKRYWPNPSAGLPGVPGIFTTFSIGDADFFLLDDRWHRDSDCTVPGFDPGRFATYRARVTDTATVPPLLALL